MLADNCSTNGLLLVGFDDIHGCVLVLHKQLWLECFSFPFVYYFSAVALHLMHLLVFLCRCFAKIDLIILMFYRLGEGRKERNKVFPYLVKRKGGDVRIV